MLVSQPSSSLRASAASDTSVLLSSIATFHPKQVTSATLSKAHCMCSQDTYHRNALIKEDKVIAGIWTNIANTPAPEAGSHPEQPLDTRGMLVSRTPPPAAACSMQTPSGSRSWCSAGV